MVLTLQRLHPSLKGALHPLNIDDVIIVINNIGNAHINIPFCQMFMNPKRNIATAAAYM
jgi:enhancing lycopene biosynthesis protein 2